MTAAGTHITTLTVLYSISQNSARTLSDVCSSPILIYAKTESAQAARNSGALAFLLIEKSVFLSHVPNR